VWEQSDAISDVSARQLSAIADLAGWASEVGIPLWLRGGWAVDFALGEITRPHEDIDWFIDVADAERVREHLVHEGWAVTRTQLNAVDLAYQGSGPEHGIGFVERRGDEVVVPYGPFAGDPWPTGMLDGPLCTLHGVTCRIITVAAHRSRSNASCRCGCPARPVARKIWPTSSD